MRLAALTLLAFILLGTAVVSAATPARQTLSLAGGRGVIQIKGKGPLLGRIEKGSLQIVDQSLGDQWSPFVNGIPRGKVVWMRGENISFRIPDGRYRIIAQGEGIYIDTRGAGEVSLDGKADSVGLTGTYQIGDDPRQLIPVSAVKLTFGTTVRQQSG